MDKNQLFLAQVVLELPPNYNTRIAEVKAAIQSSLQVGLTAKVKELTIYSLARDASDEVRIEPPQSKSSDRDNIIEEYAHSDMLIQIYRAAGRRNPPKYFAVVVNPKAKQPTGTCIDADSYSELKKKAEARAQKKLSLLQRKQTTDKT